MELSVNVGLLGCGTVGAMVAERLVAERQTIERRSGVRYKLKAIAVADPSKRRSRSLDGTAIGGDARAIVADPEIDVVVELIGGTAEAAELVERALERGCHVITANEELLATQGPRLQAIAAARGVSLRFEAAVAAAIPIANILEDSLAGDRVEAVAGVLSGSATFILSEMERGAGYVDALAQAQNLGFARKDPANDVNGLDAAHKLALLSRLAFGTTVTSPRIRRTGVAEISQRDVARAKMLGLRLRLVAAAVHTGDGVQAEVGPVLLPETHDFARTDGPENAIRIESRDNGALLLRGEGCGGAAGASAVLGDFVATLRALDPGRSNGRNRRLEPIAAFDPSALFAGLARCADLPQYPMWNDRLIEMPVLPRALERQTINAR